MYQRRGGGNFGLILLLMQVGRIGFENVPPATLVFLGINTILYYADPFHYSLREVCVGTYQILNGHEVYRLLLGCLYHVNDMHLYYNMSSLIWKGRQLEPLFGTNRFAWLMIVLGIVSNILLVGLNLLLKDTQFSESCAVGFSAVLFGLKVILQHYTPEGTSLIMGTIPISSKYVYWAELLLIQIIVPNVSFLGHLCGILSGLLFIQGYLDWLFIPLSLIPDLPNGPAGPTNYRPNDYPTYNYRNPDNNNSYGGRRRVLRNGVLVME